MSGFFDPPPSPQTNRAVNTHCPACDGHGLIEVPTEDGREAYARCPQCNPAPTSTREPVPVDAWWKQ